MANTKRKAVKPVKAREVNSALQTFLDEIGVKLSMAADNAGMTQSAVGDRMGIESSNVCSILRGKRNMTARTLVTTALAVGVVPQITFVPVGETVSDSGMLTFSR